MLPLETYLLDKRRQVRSFSTSSFFVYFGAHTALQYTISFTIEKSQLTTQVYAPLSYF